MCCGSDLRRAAHARAPFLRHGSQGSHLRGSPDASGGPGAWQTTKLLIFEILVVAQARVAGATTMLLVHSSSSVALVFGLDELNLPGLMFSPTSELVKNSLLVLTTSCFRSRLWLDWEELGVPTTIWSDLMYRGFPLAGGLRAPGGGSARRGASLPPSDISL